MVRLEMGFLTCPSCAASLWAALGRAVGAHRSVSHVSGRPRAACRAWHVELAERQQHRAAPRFRRVNGGVARARG